MRIKMNISFILFLFISFYLGYIKIISIILISVLIHELGHGIAAKILGINVMEIQLFPFGAIAIMENITKYGGIEELIIASVGPITSLIIALVFFQFEGNFSDLVFKYNFALFLFNLIPALPLDGGRILRNILLLRLSYKRATKILTICGKVLAILIVLFNTYLLIIGITTLSYIITGIFVFIGAIKEERNCSYVYLLSRNNKKKRVLKRKGRGIRLLTVSKATDLKSIIEQFSPMNICIIRVLDERGGILKELSEADILDGFLAKDYYSKVKDIL